MKYKKFLSVASTLSLVTGVHGVAGAGAADLYGAGPDSTKAETSLINVKANQVNVRENYFMEELRR